VLLTSGAAHKNVDTRSSIPFLLSSRARDEGSVYRKSALYTRTWLNKAK
jgi:hypothetical protein